MTSSGPGPDPPAPGAVQLREDEPLKGTGARGGPHYGGPRCGGPRLVLASFGALSAAITLALFTQIYYGDYEVVPHGSVSSDAEACSRAGTQALKAGGGALDAAAAAALCLAVLAPHSTSLDASGALVYWEYRARGGGPVLAEWGGGGAEPGGGAGPGGGERPPRLVAALAALHAARGRLPWPRLIDPALALARDGYVVSEGLAAALGAAAGAGPGSVRTAPQLAAYLESLQLNSSQELAAAWGAGAVRQAALAGAGAGAGRLYAGSAAAARAVSAALQPPPPDADEASRRVLAALLAGAAAEAGAGAAAGAGAGAAAGAGAGAGAGGVANGLAVIDSVDTYVALVTGLSEAFGSGPETAAGWRRDTPAAALDLAPAVLVAGPVCGARYVLGAESGAALAQAAAALAAGEAAAAAVERARVAVRGGGLAREAARPGTAAWLPAGAAAGDAAPPYAAVNLVQQAGDALLSYADSRGGGIASRF